MNLENMTDEELINFNGTLISEDDNLNKEEEALEKKEEIDSNDKEKTNNEEEITESNDEEIEQEDLKNSNDTEIDYKSFYEKANKPLKFKGKEIKINNPDELIQLAQQGMNYADKVNKIKPHTKFINALESENLLDKDNVNKLIAIAKGDKEAIKDIIKKHEIDPLDLDLDNVNYSNKNYIPTENQINFNDILSSVSSTEIGKNLIEEIKDNYDEKSQEYLSQKPQYIKELAEHKESGLYDIIVGEVEKQKLLGNIDNSIPFIEIYGKIGYNIMQEMTKKNNIPDKPISPKIIKKVKPTSSENIEQKVNKISSVKTLNGTTGNNNNLGNMNDEEFLKQFNKLYKN